MTRALADRLAAARSADIRRKPAGVEHEPLLHGALAGDRDLAGEIGAAEGDVDDVLAGLEPDDGARLAVGGDEPGLAVGPGPVAEDAPHEALLDALPVLGQQGHERELATAGGGGAVLGSGVVRGTTVVLGGSSMARQMWAACPRIWMPASMRAAAARLSVSRLPLLGADRAAPAQIASATRCSAEQRPSADAPCPVSRRFAHCADAAPEFQRICGGPPQAHAGRGLSRGAPARRSPRPAPCRWPCRPCRRCARRCRQTASRWP